MNIFKVVITAVLTTLAVLALGVAGIWAMWPSSAEASAAVAAHAGTWQTTTDEGAGHNGHCARLGGGHIKIGEAVITATLNLNDEQQAALAPVAQTLETWRAQAQVTCEQTEFGNLDASLAGVEQILNQSAAAMTELRPAITNFYNALDAEQQAALDEFVHKHHNRRGHRRFGH